jgi:hypothetical protein
MPTHLNLLQFIDLVIFGEMYILLSPSLRYFLQPRLTSSFLGPAFYFQASWISILPFMWQTGFHNPKLNCYT